MNVVEDDVKSEPGKTDVVAPKSQPSPTKSWVKFEEEAQNGVTTTNKNVSNEPAVIKTESIQVNLERSITSSLNDSNGPNNDNQPLRNVVLPITSVNDTIRQGFTNGDIIVTLLPVNSRFPWVTPAQFRPELVPEELMAQGLTLTVEEYVQSMELLVNDYRFTIYNICYKRILVVWITIAFSLLLGLLFSGLNGLLLFGVGITWLVINAGVIFLSIWIKFKLSRNLERCLANVNKQLLRHKIILALDDRGKISCHKVTLCFIYLDPGPCINQLQTCIEQQEREANGWEQRMDISANDIVIQGSRTTRLSRKQERAALLYLRYASRWGKERVRGYLASPPAKGGRHCPSITCPCQFIEDHLQCKPAGPCSFFLGLSDRNVRYDMGTYPVISV
ncbi:uncharacterized protein [Onthophagus taurus]|uniref:uncharacterized protein isoform X2 n=2 Tax=Onthophagus taurus TaxID=166361 RepID=UPI000C2038C2|nr:uncharacterized protein LOC111415038 isoform X2 [Onthophagus taurus]